MWMISAYKFNKLHDPECTNENYTKPVVESSCLAVNFKQNIQKNIFNFHLQLTNFFSEFKP